MRASSKWLLRRLAAIPLTVLAATGLCFLLLHWIPGGPFSGEQLADPVLRQNLETAYGLGRPWWEQWFDWCVGASQGFLGQSFQHRGVAVSGLVGDAWPASLRLGGFAVALGLFMALPSAIHAVRYPLAPFARVAVVFADALLCLPTFVTAPLLLAVFSGVPGSGLDEVGGTTSFFLGGISLALPVGAIAFRWARVGLQEVCAARWWTAVAARPLRDTLRWWRYAMGYAWPGLAGRLSPVVADVLTGALAVEAVFGIPGLGGLLGTAALHRDAPVLLAAVSCSVITVMAVQTVLDSFHRAPLRRTPLRTTTWGMAPVGNVAAVAEPANTDTAQ